MAGRMSNSAPSAFAAETLEDLCGHLVRVSTEANDGFAPGMVALPLDTASLLDQLPDFIYIKDCQGRFVYANAAARRNAELISGVTDLIGKTDFDFLSSESALHLFAQEQEVMSRGEPIQA